MPVERVRALRLTLLGIALAVLLVGSAAGAAPAYAVQPQPLANVRGVVWYDGNGDGLRQEGEPAAAGASLEFSPAVGLPGIYSNADGAFAVSLPGGAYTIDVWWDSPGVTPRAPNGRGAAYYSTTVRIEGGANQEVDVGIRPTGRFPALVDARIETVWPHDAAGQAAPAGEAALANVVAYLFQAGTQYSVPCGYAPWVMLVAALDDQPGRVVAIGVKRVVTVEGRTFPTWAFDNVDVSAARPAGHRLYFWLQVADDLTPDGLRYAAPRFRSNVWAHGLDGRTYSPIPAAPTGTAVPDRLAARVDVLWPHDGQGHERPVDSARFANVEVLLTDAAQPSLSLAATAAPDVWLLKSLNGAVPEVVRGRRVLVGNADPPYPRWLFEDVDVGDARDPANRYYFRVFVAGRPVATNVWAHGLDGRTYFPARDLPLETAEGCR